MSLKSCLARSLGVLLAASFLPWGSAWAQAARARAREELVFQSNRPWKLTRFYAIGRIDSAGRQVRWLGAEAGTPIRFTGVKCPTATGLKAPIRKAQAASAGFSGAEVIELDRIS